MQNSIPTLTDLAALADIVIANGQSYTSGEIVLAKPDGSVHGFFSLDVTHTGGSLTAEVLTSNGSTFKAHEGAAAILSAKAAGGYLASFSVPVCRAFKIKLTASSADCTVSECIVAAL